MFLSSNNNNLINWSNKTSSLFFLPHRLIPQLVRPKTNENNKKSGHRRTPSIIGPLANSLLSNGGMAKIAPAAPPPFADDAGNATIMGLMGVGAGEDTQLDIPIFKTEEGRYLATGTEYLIATQREAWLLIAPLPVCPSLPRSVCLCSSGRPSGERLDGSGEPTS